ncbi:MAG: 1-acyl-sn-glycerol-3-phosphate acyltransferase [Betaproteobacteria bacterium]|nr:1-acyl-sn-glycerol-3-phosphate acyltransferase [Betaproteobacteria bacterium]
MTNFNHYWRLVVTASCFAGFGLGGLFLATLVFPSMRVLPGGRKRRVLRAQWMVHKGFSAMVWTLRTFGAMRLDIRSGDRLRNCGGALIVANHPTILDIVVMFSLMPNACCVVKSGAWRNPFMRGVVSAAGYINNSAPDSLIEDCAAELAAGTPLVIFPEGTRTRAGRDLKFLRGAAYVALRSNCPLLPVVLRCDPPTLSKGEKWYRIPARPFHYSVDVQRPLQFERLIDSALPPAIAARQLTEALERYFTKELAVYGNAEVGNQAAAH